MKKYLPLAALMILGMVLAAAIVIVVSDKDESVTQPKTSKNESDNAKAADRKTPEACVIFPLDRAQSVMGKGIVKGDNTTGVSSTNDIVVSSCTYTTTAKSVEAIANTKTASVLVRAAKTDAGATSNKSAFAENKPAGVQVVSGYGEAAFWNPQLGQLSILKNDNWYILTYGSSTTTGRTLDEAKKLAEILKSSL